MHLFVIYRRDSISDEANLALLIEAMYAVSFYLCVQSAMPAVQCQIINAIIRVNLR